MWGEIQFALHQYATYELMCILVLSLEQKSVGLLINGAWYQELYLQYFLPYDRLSQHYIWLCSFVSSIPFYTKALAFRLSSFTISYPPDLHLHFLHLKMQKNSSIAGQRGFLSPVSYQSVTWLQTDGVLHSFHQFPLNVTHLAPFCFWDYVSLSGLYFSSLILYLSRFYQSNIFITPSAAPGTHSGSSIMCIFLYSPSLSVI